MQVPSGKCPECLLTQVLHTPLLSMRGWHGQHFGKRMCSRIISQGRLRHAAGREMC